MGGEPVARGLDRPSRENDGSREDGASLVEMALILPLLLMLLLGIVSAGIAYNHQLSLTHAAREAGRYGATLPTTNFANLDDWKAEVEARAVEASTGSLDPADPDHELCVAYVHPAAGQTDECFDDNRPDGEARVQVQTARDVEINALVFQTTVTIGSEAANRFEAALGS